jgi:hypothetical protein
MPAANAAWQVFSGPKDPDRYTAALLRLSTIHVDLLKIREELKRDGYAAKARVAIVQAANKVELAALELQNQTDF